MALTQVKAGGLIADAIDETKLADDSIDSEHYNAASIDNEHLADDAVGVDELSATGTAGNTTYLRGDNTWTVPPNTTYSVGDGGLTSNDFTNTDHSKLDGIETSADVTDATNVNAAGAVMESDVDAKGDIFAGTADNTVSRLAVGTNDHVLTADSSTATGLKWASSGGGGVTSDSDENTVAGTNAGDSFDGNADGNSCFGYNAGTAITSGDYNTAIGREALAASSTANGNTAVGSRAAESVTTNGGTAALGWEAARYNTSDYNTAIGYAALKGSSGNSTGAANTALGGMALQDNTSGGNNVGLGYKSLENNTTGLSNVSIGWKTMDTNTTGSDNVAVGREALFTNDTGNYNVAIGENALKANTVSNQVAVGFDALLSHSSGLGRNTALGDMCLRLVETGWANTAAGYRAGNQVTGDHNTLIGHEAGNSVNTGDGNTFMGYNAGYIHTTGDKNTYVGYLAGYGTGSGTCSNNTHIGHGAGYSTNADYQTCVGHNAGYSLSTGVNTMLLGYNAGSVSSPSGTINDDSNVICLGNDQIANLYCNDTSISSSDQRDKTDIANFTQGLSWVNQLRPVTYRWDKRSWYLTDKKVTQDQIDNGEYTQTQLGEHIPSTKAELLAATPDGSKKNPKKHIGFLAQEVLAVEKSSGFAVDKNDMLTVNLTTDETQYGMKYERLVPVLVNAIKELSAKNDALEARLATLEAA